jgi:hypothetical protein
LPLRVHYESLERQTGKQFYERVECPELASHVWEWYIELFNEFSDKGGRIKFRDILDWQGMTFNKLEPWELKAIRAINKEHINGRSDPSVGS